MQPWDPPKGPGNLEESRYLPLRLLLITVSRAYGVCTEICGINNWMGNRPCCRSCRHCTPPNGAQLGWCQLRKLPIHGDLASDLWCHHWTARPPRLPLGPDDGSLVSESSNRQLALTDVLES